MACRVTRASIKSAGVVGTKVPFATPPSEWPDRPTRCSPRATPLGLFRSTTRSMVPMSIPNSRLVEETAQREFAGLHAPLDIEAHIAVERGMMGLDLLGMDHVLGILFPFFQAPRRSACGGQR